jgi:glucose-1-phosphatase
MQITPIISLTNFHISTFSHFHIYPMSHIENIIFDLGGVILNIDNKRTEEAFTKLGAKDFGRYFGHGFAASFFRDYEIGKISDQQFIHELKKMIAIDVPNQIITEAWNALLLDFPGKRIALLRELRKEYRLFLFSNTNSLHLHALRIIYRNEFTGGDLDELFEKTYYSHILGMRKPDRESYEFIIRENKLNPESTLFVDDAKINVEGANNVGLQGFYLEPTMDITDIRWK